MLNTPTTYHCITFGFVFFYYMYGKLEEHIICFAGSLANMSTSKAILGMLNAINYQKFPSLEFFCFLFRKLKGLVVKTFDNVLYVKHLCNKNLT